MTYRLDFTKRAQEDIAFHKKSGNKSVLNKIAVLLEELTETPFIGTGKPEPLKHQFSGMWSRRINREHRLVYEVLESAIGNSPRQRTLRVTPISICSSRKNGKRLVNKSKG